MGVTLLLISGFRSVAQQRHFENTAAFRWLRTHAQDHGFSLSYPRGNAFGITYEPWHWAFEPVSR